MPRRKLHDQRRRAFYLATRAMLVGLSKSGLPIVGAQRADPRLRRLPVHAAGLLLPIFVVSDWFGHGAIARFSGRNLAILVPGAVVGISLGWLYHAAHVSGTR